VAVVFIIYPELWREFVLACSSSQMADATTALIERSKKKSDRFEHEVLDCFSCFIFSPSAN
jgi:hypothetical protein